MKIITSSCCFTGSVGNCGDINLLDAFFCIVRKSSHRFVFIMRSGRNLIKSIKLHKTYLYKSNKLRGVRTNFLMLLPPPLQKIMIVYSSVLSHHLFSCLFLFFLSCSLSLSLSGDICSVSSPLVSAVLLWSGLTMSSLGQENTNITCRAVTPHIHTRLHMQNSWNKKKGKTFAHYKTEYNSRQYAIYNVCLKHQHSDIKKLMG